MPREKTPALAIVPILGCIVIATLLVMCNAMFSLWIPPPSDAAIEHAIRFAPGNGGPGVGNDGRTYEITRIDRPSAAGVADPKMWIWLRVREADGTLVTEGLLNIALIMSNPNHLAIGSLIPRSEITEELLTSTFTENEIRRIRRLMSQY